MGGKNLEFIASANFYLSVKKNKHSLRYLRYRAQASFKDLLKFFIVYVNSWEDMSVKRHSLGER